MGEPPCYAGFLDEEGNVIEPLVPSSEDPLKDEQEVDDVKAQEQEQPSSR